MNEREIEVNGKKIKIAIKLSQDEIENNNDKILLDDTIDLTDELEKLKRTENDD